MLVQSLQDVKVVVVKSDYWVGFDQYCAGQSLEAMLSDGERRGWMGACRAEGEAMMDGCIEDDHEFIRRGGA